MNKYNYQNATFVSGCDAHYFPMLLEWVHSIRRFDASYNIDICILDAGLTKDQKDILTPLVSTIKEPDWPEGIPSSKKSGKNYLKACICRPFLPDIFPGYDMYFWMDADTWVQNWYGVELFLMGASKNKISLTAQVDRGYARGGARIKWLGSLPWKVRGFYFSNARKAFDFQTAKALLPYHVLLAGAFALRADAPHWKPWQELAIQAVQKGKLFTAEQLSLGVLCYLKNFEYEILPAYSHWLCEFKPLWDEKKEVFIEPFIPHNELGILHLSGFDEMRLDRSLNTSFKTLQGSINDLSYRYPYFDGENNKSLIQPAKKNKRQTIEPLEGKAMAKSS